MIRRFRKWRFVITPLASLLLIALTLYLVRDRFAAPRFAHVEPLPRTVAAPPDIAKVRVDFVAGVTALNEGDPADAVKLLSRIDLEGRSLEEYRLYYLANAQQAIGRVVAARRTLAQLWRGNPRLFYRNDAGFHLASLYQEAGSWSEAATVYAALAERADMPAVEAVAGLSALRARLVSGDVGGALAAARRVAIVTPASPEAADALAVERAVRSLPGAALPFTVTERVQRGESLVRNGKPTEALRELESLARAGGTVGLHVTLARGTAMSQLKQYENSDKTLAPLFGTHYKYAIPALALSAKNNRMIAASINPTVLKQVKEKKRVGTRRVKRKGKTVKVPQYRTVTRTVKLVDLAKKRKKEMHDATMVERYKDLLQIPSPPSVKREALNALIVRATEKKQDDYLKELASQLVKVDPAEEPVLQHFWDKAWAAYVRGDFETARANFSFVSETYTNPNVKRQARYWYARTIERQGQKEKARETYKELAASPYRDLYAKFAADRLGKDAPEPAKPKKRPSWSEVADKEMPQELRLAHELSIVGLARDARLETQANQNFENRKYADAILADILYAQNAPQAAYRLARRAYPQLATVEQDVVPDRFFEMYYPLRYEEIIRKEAAERKLDPYLVMALIRQESAFDPNARSHVGATGLMQIMPATGKELGKKLYRVFSINRLTDPETNVEMGTYYLAQVIRLLGGNVELALAGYNGGPYRIKRWREANRQKPLDEFIEGIPLSESRNYVKRITLLRGTYAQIAETR